MGLGSTIDRDPRGVARDLANTALGVATSGPLTRATFAATGTAPYLEREGGFRQVGHPEDNGVADVAGWLKNAAAGLTNATAQFSDDDAARPYGTSLPGRVANWALPPFVTKGRGGDATLWHASEDDRAVVIDRTRQLMRARGDTVRQRQIIEDAVRSAAENGLNADYRRGQLERAMNQINEGGSESGGLRRLRAFRESTSP
jgi:hypothetical protein